MHTVRQAIHDFVMLEVQQVYTHINAVHMMAEICGVKLG